jgi:hypothetical protein
MRLLIVNASPRGPQGASELIARKLTTGFDSTGDDGWEVLRLAEPKEAARAPEAFAEAEMVVIVIPMYTESLPALAKGLIEDLRPFAGREGNPALGFVIHSGLPGAGRCRAMERYCQRLGERLGCRYLGTAVRGGTEGLRAQKPEAIAKVLAPVAAIGRSLALSGEFDAAAVAEFADPERLSPMTMALLRPAYYLPGSQRIWDQALRATGAFYARFARPYK